MKKISPIHYLFGCRFDTLVKLLIQNKFRIDKQKKLQFFAIFFVSLILYPFTLLEDLLSYFLCKRNMKASPLFILGFWRSGTTYLQNLLCEDKNFSYLDTMTSYGSNNVILLNPIIKTFMKKYSSKFRFMDNMECKIDSPCEEEFAVANRTTKSIVHMSTFTDNFGLYKKFAFTKNLTKREINSWKRVYKKIIKKTYFLKKQKPLILKSPDNTCHINELVELFPDSKFVYIYRNPYKVICSFKHTITKMMEHFSLQNIPDEQLIDDFVVDFYKQTMNEYEKNKPKLKDKLIEIKYEDFIQNPLYYLEQIYIKLNISGFNDAKKNFQKLLQSQKDYKTNKYKISPKLKLKIQNELKDIFLEYGYEM